MIGLFARRCAAAAVDGAVSLLLALLMSTTLGDLFARRAVIALRIGEPDTLWTGPLPMALGLLGGIVYLLPLTLLLTWLAEPLTGRTPGHALLRLEIHGTKRWTRYLFKAAGPLLLVSGLLAGRWEPLIAGIAASILMSAGFLAGAPRGSTLHDRAAGTRLTKERGR